MARNNKGDRTMSWNVDITVDGELVFCLGSDDQVMLTCGAEIYEKVGHALDESRSYLQGVMGGDVDATTGFVDESGKRKWLSDAEMNRLAIEVVRVLDGAPLGQARRILEMAQEFIDDGHVVDVDNPRFIAQDREFTIRGEVGS